MTRLAAMAAVWTVALALAACGGSDGGGADEGGSADSAAPAPAATAPSVGGAAPAPAGGPSRKRYIKQADRICRAARAKLVPIRSGIVGASKAADPDTVFRRYADLTGRAAAVYSSVLGQIRSLDVPAADQAQIERLNALLAQIASATREMSAAAAAQDAQRLRELNLQVTTVANGYRAAARAYGFRQCGQTAGSTLERRGNR
jgi:hypothetical protein